MYGRGAFRSLIAYLESELPKRGFKGVFLEQVHNEHLQSVALRYGFERLTEPSRFASSSGSLRRNKDDQVAGCKCRAA